MTITRAKLVPIAFQAAFNELPTEYKMIIRQSLPNIALKQLILNLEREYANTLCTLDVSMPAGEFQMRYVAVRQMQACMKEFLQFINQLGEDK